jgi:hypothetical protein
MQNHEAVIDSLRHRLLARRASIIGRVTRTEDLLSQDEAQATSEVERGAGQSEARLAAARRARARGDRASRRAASARRTANC